MRILDKIFIKSMAALDAFRDPSRVHARFSGVGGRIPSLNNWRPPISDFKQDVVRDLPELRSKSRDLDQNTLARGMVDALTTPVVGTGLVMQSKIDYKKLGISRAKAKILEKEIESRWNSWSKSRQCDASRKGNFASLQRLAYRSSLVSGDVFAQTVIRDGKYCLSLLEADMVESPLGYDMGPDWSGGVKTNQFGEPVAYHVLDAHPGALFAGGKDGREVPAKNAADIYNIIHFFGSDRPGQSRGYPWLAPVMPYIKKLAIFDNSHLEAAMVQSYLTVFTKTQDGVAFDQTTIGADSKQEITLGPGAVNNLSPGQDVSFLTPTAPTGNYTPFIMAQLNQICAILRVPLEFVMMAITSSYTAFRGTQVLLWQKVEEERSRFQDGFLDPIFRTWLTFEVINGLDLFGFFDSEENQMAYANRLWIGPGMPQVDPGKDAQADSLEIQSGFTSRQRVIARRGHDYEEIQEELAEEMEQRKALGLIDDEKAKKEKGTDGEDD